VHYKDEAFSKILRASVHVQDVQMANDIADLWSKTGDNVGSGVVDAWRVEGRTKEAIDAARKIEDPNLRIGELLGIAGDLLNEAGRRSSSARPIVFKSRESRQSRHNICT
jgi:hypothetical protein